VVLLDNSDNLSTLIAFVLINASLSIAIIILCIKTTKIDPHSENYYKNKEDHGSKEFNLKCMICNITVNDSAKHCGVCNKCIAGFDHHCVWLNNCIGHSNYKLFIWLISLYFSQSILWQSLLSYAVHKFTAMDE